MIVGDFNMYRSMDDRNKSGGDMKDIFTFNDIISNLGLQEIPLKGRKYTWSNMQEDPLLEQIYWCFTSANWIQSYPNTLMLPLSKPTSNHTPCKIQIGTAIPKAQIFRFENHWIQQPGFLEIVQPVWNSEIRGNDIASRISAKFKLLRRILKHWGKTLSQVNTAIQTCNDVISILDSLEENRQLYKQEHNFRKILRGHILKLLERKKIFWKQRYTVRWTKFGDESTSFFHAAATERFRINNISSLENNLGELVSGHHEKANMIWEEFRERMGQSTDPDMLFHLPDILTPGSLHDLPVQYTHKDIDKVVRAMPANKAPGPDGFNGTIYKKCWDKIKHDIYQLCDEFFQTNINL
jgi:hypothetical protein